MANLAQEIAHAGMVLQIPRCQVRWQPLDLEGPRRGVVASARSRIDRNVAGSPFAPTRSQSLRSPFGPRSSGGISTRPRAPNVRASPMARPVASRSSAT